jgi:hypothetical protein
MLRHCFHGGFEILMGRIDEQPLSQNVMRHQRRELGSNGSVMFVARTDQNPVPVPATGFRWLDEQQHLTLEEIRGKPTEHPPGEEGPVLSKRLENPLVFERLHVIRHRRFPPRWLANRRPGNRRTLIVVRPGRRSDQCGSRGEPAARMRRLRRRRESWPPPSARTDRWR